MILSRLNSGTPLGNFNRFGGVLIGWGELIIVFLHAI